VFLQSDASSYTKRELLAAITLAAGTLGFSNLANAANEPSVSACNSRLQRQLQSPEQMLDIILNSC
jgi:hypothetical protein